MIKIYICSNQKVHDVFQVQIEKSLKSSEGNERFIIMILISSLANFQVNIFLQVPHWKVILLSVMINRNDIETCEKPSLDKGNRDHNEYIHTIHVYNTCI